MTRNLNTLYSYIHTHNTEYVNSFIMHIGYDAINKLPNKVCSSKILYDILLDDLDTYFKKSIFRLTFLEYFKWKLLYSEYC